MLHKKTKISVILVLTFTIFLLYLHLLPLSTLNRIKHDIVSWSLPAQAAIDNLGVAYKDYLEIKPPGIILVTQVWLAIFGNKYQFYLLLHTIFLSVSIFGMMRIWYLNFNKWVAGWLSISGAVMFLSPLIQTQFVGSELYGLALATVALNLLMPLERVNGFKIFSASALFLLSGQMKDPYMFTFLAFIPVLLYYYLYKKKKLKGSIISFVAGSLTAVAIIVGYLLYYENLNAYWEVLNLKKQIFLRLSLTELSKRLIYAINYPFKNLLYLKIPYTSLLIFFSISLAAILNKKKSFRKYIQLENLLHESAIEKMTLVAFAFGSFIGEALQFRFSTSYIIPVLFPMFIIQATLLVFILGFLSKTIPSKYSKNNWTFSLFVFAFVIFLTLPKYAFFKSYPTNKIKTESLIDNIMTTINNKDTLLPEEKKIIENTSKDECIMRVYGWAAGTTYFYTHRQPCTRWFLPHVMPIQYADEYINAIINNVPAAIYYTQEKADFNIKVFEESIFDYSSVLENCYLQDENYAALYFPRYNKENMHKCIEENYKKK